MSKGKKKKGRTTRTQVEQERLCDNYGRRRRCQRRFEEIDALPPSDRTVVSDAPLRTQVRVVTLTYLFNSSLTQERDGEVVDCLPTRRVSADLFARPSRPTVKFPGSLATIAESVSSACIQSPDAAANSAVFMTETSVPLALFAEADAAMEKCSSAL